ncbi:hypothetical protein NKR23_g1482 [Pleurostoma richardsiae]|uniref:Uncharacterized protein n=1 Tax=Pleurostoma richardsiae TaxID=41990 RepID=A0AA38S5K1_9PEZI|nr:hypothetical protein NKR23_g1482 [Pleurostoma richardsiae]
MMLFQMELPFLPSRSVIVKRSLSLIDCRHDGTTSECSSSSSNNNNNNNNNTTTTATTTMTFAEEFSSALSSLPTLVAAALPAPTTCPVSPGPPSVPPCPVGSFWAAWAPESGWLGWFSLFSSLLLAAAGLGGAWAVLRGRPVGRVSIAWGLVSVEVWGDQGRSREHHAGAQTV